MKLYKLTIIAILCFAFLQCKRELSYYGSPDAEVVVPEPFSTNLQGTVLDENGLPAAGVTVKAGTNTIITDSRGFFHANNVTLDKKSALVTAEKTGYFKAYRTFAATTATNQVVLKLVKRVLAGTVSASAGGSVTLSNGSKIELPAGGIVKVTDNSAFTGTVNVYAAYIDPTTSDIDQTIPGSLMANDKNGARLTLTSYGMLAVELESPAVEKLQIKSGAQAVLTTAIPSSLQSSAPSSIPLWSVDEKTGLWKEESSAAKQGNNYVGNVNHFSFWNCDVSMNAVVLSLTLYNAASQPLVYARVRIKKTSGNTSQAYGYTDSLGQVSGYVPSNTALLLELLDQCGNTIYSQNIGPFTQSTNLGTITVNPGSTLPVVTVTGKLFTCNNTAVINGFAILYYGTLTRYAATDANGNFSTNFITCSASPATLDVIGVDNSASQQSALQTVTVANPTTNTGNVTVCGTSSLQYINYIIDGNSYSLSSINAADSLTAWTISGTTGYTTTISGSRIATGSFTSFTIGFNHITQATGTYPLSTLYYNLATGTGRASSFIQPSTATVTSFPTATGQYYEGTFTAQFVDSSVNHTASGSFRLRR